MNAIQLKLYKSALDTVKNDYTAIVVASGTIDVEELYRQAAEKEPNLSDVSVRLAFDTWMRHIAESLAEGLFVNFGGIGLMAMVEGSLLHMDEDVPSDRLGVQVTMFDNAFTEAIASLKVATSVDEDALAYIFSRVEDETVNKLNVVTPGGRVKLIGERLAYGLEGETVTITDSTGATRDLTEVFGATDGNWLEGTAPAELAPGKGVVTTLCRGLKTPEGPLSKATKAVTILAGDAPKGPKITKIVNKDGVANAWHPFGDELDLTAANAADEDATVTVELLEKSTGNVKAILPYTDGNTLERVDAKTFRLYFRANPTDCPDSMWADTTRYATVIRVKTDNGEAVSEPLAIV